MFRRGSVCLILAIALVAAGGCATKHSKRSSAEPVFYPPPPDPPHMQFLMSIGADTDIPGSRRGLVRVLLGDKPLQRLGRPRGVGVHAGIIYVADASFHTVITIDLARKSFGWIQDSGGGKLVNPIGLHIAEDGSLYVADAARREVLAYAPGGRPFLRTYGDPKTLRPTDVVVIGDRVYITDIADHEIEVYDRKTAERITVLGKEGEGPGEFKFPNFLAAGPDGTLYVTDSMNFRVQRLSSDGKPLASYGKLGDWTGSLTRPKGIAVDRDGLLHVLDAGFENAQIFLPDGTAATFYGGFGNVPGHMYLPFGVCVDESLLPLLQKYVDPRLKPRHVILVTNQSGPHKLNIYVFGDPVQAEGSSG